VRLPVAPFAPRVEEEQRRHPLVGDGAHAAAETRLDGSRVLVVDDEPDANESLSVLLSSFGAEVRVAASTGQALEILDEWLPEVIVSDVGMPGEDGYALIARVRALQGGGARVPAIALTAYASVED